MWGDVWWGKTYVNVTFKKYHLLLIYRQYAGYDYSQQGQFVPTDMMHPQQPYHGHIFQPTSHASSTSQTIYGNSFEDEPPLLEGRK